MSPCEFKDVFLFKLRSKDRHSEVEILLIFVFFLVEVSSEPQLKIIMVDEESEISVFVDVLLLNILVSHLERCLYQLEMQ